MKKFRVTTSDPHRVFDADFYTLVIKREYVILQMFVREGGGRRTIFEAAYHRRTVKIEEVPE